MPSAPCNEDVVVTGIGITTALGIGVDAFTRALRLGDPASPPSHSGGLLLIRDFNLLAFWNSLHLAKDVSPSVRQAARRAPLSLQLSLAVALEAWQNAGLFHDAFYAPEQAALIVAGHNLNLRTSYELAEKYCSRLDYLPASHALHFMDTDQVGFLSEALGIRGEGFTVGGASASGNSGLIQGLRQITCRNAQVCAVVGAMTDLSPLEIHSFTAAGAMAPDGVCRPFDRDRRGFVYGQGAACLILETAAGARSRCRKPLGILRGGAQCLEANRSAEPSPEGEARAMRMAMTYAGVLPSEVDYVNTHGTASVLGDQVEFDALSNVFGDHFPNVWLNSTKALTGHCLTAAGALEAVATLIQMNGGFLHPTAGLENPLAAGGRFVGPTAIDATPRIALSNSFGFGGINTSVVIEHIEHTEVF
ncbi:MAG TPA: beta-ketoacyl synthase N-terminal-like domain-containing protein [Acidobacteriaceae bacterium]|jgi:malonyl-ACP decarboxylase|nr:beta-ketoacyl synthase N-terminal-like domain-containing protein [Acidobacteriaceae bacterium]